MSGRRVLQLIAIAVVAVLAACSEMTINSSTAPPSIANAPFGQVGAMPVSRYTLTNGHGMRVRILTYGGIIQSIEVPDRTGVVDDVVLGFPTLAGYLNNTGAAKPYFGAIVGRYGNRIAHGDFSLNGNEYHVATNANGNGLHGGPASFDTKVWQASQRNASDSVSLELQYVSPAGEMGYPGTLAAAVTTPWDRTTNCASTTTRPLMHRR